MKILALALAICFCTAAVSSTFNTAHAVGVRIDPNGAP